ncbi:hypothetical protein EOD39_18358 [Acipenser ruthenus]|uniref:Uncharacterized protein n=1 Tax=Acipenser ruthenus TaxID=7906 RepID=A0A444V0X2_ACIRT|nr:hypothetical protein EOD39_18358 [Acipenser ruthenus]
MLEGACRLRPPLRVLGNLLTVNSDPKLLGHLTQEINIPHFLLELIGSILENQTVVQLSLSPPAGWGLFDGLLTLLYQALSEGDGSTASQFMDSALWRFLWLRVGVALEEGRPHWDCFSHNAVSVASSPSPGAAPCLALPSPSQRPSILHPSIHSGI